MTKFSQKRFNDDKKTKVIAEAKDHISNFRTLWEDNLNMYEEMTRFINGQMWEKDAEAAYKRSQRVMLTFNKIRPYIKQIVGEDLGFSVDIKIRNISTIETVGDQQAKEADQNKDLLAGLVRNIAYHSRTQQIYGNSYIQVLEGGFSAWRVLVIDDGENRALRIRGVDNPLQCYWDLSAKNKTKTDGDFCGLVSYMSKDAFMRDYPGYPYPDSFTSADTYKNDWGDENRIAICEEYRRETYKEKVYITQDGQEFSEEDLEENPLIEPMIVRERTDKKSRIVHYKFTDHYLLDWTETPFTDLPLVCVPGYSRIIDGKQRTYSFAIDAKDPQRMLNFIGSEIAQWLKITKKTKFLSPAKMIDAFIKDWQDPDSPSTALQYDPSVAPGYKPEPIPALPMPQDLVEQYQRAEQDIQIALGRYESNIGARSNEVSGIAIFNKAMQGNSTLAEYRDARNEAIAETGKIILNAIPNIYDAERTISITNENDEDEEVKINSPKLDLNSGQYQMKKTFEKNKYSVEVDVGDSFPMQRSATAQLGIELIKADPTGQAYPLVADIIAESIDVDGALKIAERLRTLVPPQIIAQETGKPTPPDPNQVMQQQMAQQMAQLQMQEQQIKIQAQQLQMQVEQQKASDDHLRALNDRMKALSDVLNAQTNQAKVGNDVALSKQKLAAEMARTEAEILKVESQEAREHMKFHLESLRGAHEMSNNNKEANKNDNS